MVNYKVNFITFANLTFKNYKTPFALEFISSLKNNKINFNIYCKYVFSFKKNYKSVFNLLKILKLKILKYNREQIENEFQLSCLKIIIKDNRSLYFIHPGRFNLISNYLKENKLIIVNILTGLSFAQELKLINFYNYENFYKNKNKSIDIKSDYSISMGSNTFKSYNFKKDDKNFIINPINKISLNSIDNYAVSNFNKNIKKIIYPIGNFSLMKGIEFAIKAWNTKTHEYELHITVSEKQAQKEHLELYNLAKSNKNICFIGNIKNLNKKLFKWDALLLTSLSEGFPKVLIESIINKVPIISTPTAGEFLLDNKHYLEVPFGDFKNIIDKIDLLNDNKKLRTNIINNAFDHISSYPDTTKQITHILQKIRL